MNQFRIAIVAALMATPALAWDRSLSGGDWTCDDLGQCHLITPDFWQSSGPYTAPPQNDVRCVSGCSGGVSDMSGSISGGAALTVTRPSSPTDAETSGSLPYNVSFPPKTKCDVGWTLVPVGHATDPTVIYKCAAVGDLRDPE
jgi:hypothetical protein